MIELFFSLFSQILLIILICFLALIIFRLLRFLFNYLIYLRLCLKYKPKIKHNRWKKYSIKPSNKTDFRKKDQKQELIEKIEQLKNRDRTNTEIEIVGIAEPIGKWTKFVTQQKINWLRAMVGGKTDSDKFWQNMIKAQQQAGSKFKGRGGPSM